MLFNKHFKKMLNVLLLVLIIVSLTCYYFVLCKSHMSIIEGYDYKKKGSRKSKKRRNKNRKRNRKRNRRRRNRKNRAAAAKITIDRNKNIQDEIYKKVESGTANSKISNCAVLYGNKLQLGKENAELFGIFGNNNILTCDKDGNPNFVPAKLKKINEKGLTFTDKTKTKTKTKMTYGDTVSLCGKIYNIGNIDGKNAATEVKYGDKISMTPADNKGKGMLKATIHPNVYSLPNLLNLDISDYTREYDTNYELCGNSGGGGGITATK